MVLSEAEEWKGYCGRMPEPEDFTKFWKERMEEADRIPLVYKIEDSEIADRKPIVYKMLWFTGIKGENIGVKYIRPNTKENIPLILQFHGYPGASRSWLELSSYAGMGCALLAMDCPGQGGFSKDAGGYPGTTVVGHVVAGLEGKPEELYYVRLYQNIRILCRIVKELKGVDLSRIYVNGASQGGAQGLACAALNPELINRAAILYPFLSDFRMVWEMGADEVAYEGLRYYSRWFDPDGSKADSWFWKLSYIDSKNFAPMVKCPVLFGTGLEDEICPPITQCAVYNRLNCPKKHYFYPGLGHEEIQEFDDLTIDFFGRREPLL